MHLPEKTPLSVNDMKQLAYDMKDAFDEEILLDLLIENNLNPDNFISQEQYKKAAEPFLKSLMEKMANRFIKTLHPLANGNNPQEYIIEERN